MEASSRDRSDAIVLDPTAANRRCWASARLHGRSLFYADQLQRMSGQLDVRAFCARRNAMNVCRTCIGSDYSKSLYSYDDSEQDDPN